MRKVEALQVIKQIRGIGVTQISERTLKDWFAKRDYIHTTGLQIKEYAKELGINLKPCKTVIPSDFMPTTEEKEVFVLGIFTKKELTDLYIKQDLSIKEIKEIKGCEIGAVYVNLRKYSIKVKEKNTIKSNVKKDINKIIEMNKGGMTLKDIAVIYKCSPPFLGEILRNNGYKTRKLNKERG